MAIRNPDKGLLKEILDVIHELGADECHRPEDITERLLAKNYWPPGKARTPNQTVTSYLSQKSEIFCSTYGAQYFLRDAFKRPDPSRLLRESIFKELKQVARSERTTTYAQIAQSVHLDMGRADHSEKISRILDEISRHEHSLRHPLVSAVVVQSDGAGNGTVPGVGFFTMAKELGLQGKLDNVTFFARELIKVHEVWRKGASRK